MPTIVRVQVQGNLAWQVTQGKGGNWVAVCDPLRLTIQSETYAELMEDIGLSLNALMADLLAENELDGFLKEQGWMPIGPIPSEPSAVRFDVPFMAAMTEADGSARHVH
jgi:hypothetical protein